MPFLIYGAGGFAREVAWLIESSVSDFSAEAEGNVYSKVIGFFADEPTVKTLNGKPVMDFSEALSKYPGADVAIGVGDPKGREKMVAKCEKVGFKSARKLIYRDVRMSEHNEIGEGAIICAGSILTTNITLGRYVHVNLDCTIGHDAVLGDFTTLAPGVHVSGRVTLGKRVYVGTGAVIINGDPHGAHIKIEDDSIIAAGSAVIRDTAGSGLYAGVPAIQKRKF